MLRLVGLAGRSEAVPQDAPVPMPERQAEVRVELFNILLEHNFIKPFDHKVLMSYLDAKEQEYCKLHNSFGHDTQNCNIFCQIIQSSINSG